MVGVKNNFRIVVVPQIAFSVQKPQRSDRHSRTEDAALAEPNYLKPRPLALQLRDQHRLPFGYLSLARYAVSLG